MTAMNSYITLDSKKYTCVFKQWNPATDKPMTVRYTWSGSIDVTYGPAMFHSWRGTIMAAADNSSDLSFGSVSDIRNVIAKLQSVQMIDHYGATYTVHVQPIGEERSYSPRWDNKGNMILFPVQIYAEA